MNTRFFQRECARVVSEGLLIPLLMYGKETDVEGREKGRSRIRDIQIDKLVVWWL